MPYTNRPSLSNVLDKDVLAITRRYEDAHSQNEEKARLDVRDIYEYIKHSNSSLSRKPRKLLEDSIDRVLAVLNIEREADSEFSQNEMSSEPGPHQAPSNAMNHSIVKAWKLGSNGATNGQKKKREAPLDENSAQASTPKRKRNKDSSSSVKTTTSGVTLDQLGAIGPILRKLFDLVGTQMAFPSLSAGDITQETRGVLLHGPPGCGKTAIVNAFAAEIGVSFMQISAPSIVSGMSGESEKKLRDCFDEASQQAPCIMFIDEIDAITPKREGAQREMEKRIVSQMLTCFDGLAQGKHNSNPVVVIAATNRPDSIDPALRRAGRFDAEISVGVPNEFARQQILKSLTRRQKLGDDIDLGTLAKKTPGYVGADLASLVTAAHQARKQRILSDLEQQAKNNDNAAMKLGDSEETPDPELVRMRLLLKMSMTQTSSQTPSIGPITSSDFVHALTQVQPSCTREGFATVPETSWDDVGALHQLRAELKMAIIEPISRPEIFAAMDAHPSAGVLLWGPPGCGKTLLAKAVANESQANFISVKGPELLSKWVGDSEKAVRQVFARARASAPCIIFFDEFDSLVPSRSGGEGGGSGNDYMARVVNSFLTELDGLGDRQGVYIMAATNKPETIDTAVLRPGRLGKKLFVGLPDVLERTEILEKLVRRTPHRVELTKLAESCKGFSGADLMGVMDEAKLYAISRGAGMVEDMDVEEAGRKVKRTVMDEGRYKRLLDEGDWR